MNSASRVLLFSLLFFLHQFVRADESFQELLRAASQGNTKAQVKVGNAYNFGKNVEQDYAESVKWYTKAAAQGDAEAQLNLGVMYMNGQGVKRDSKRAEFWYQKSAEQGYAPAEEAMGLISQNGDMAAKWFLKAAEHGYPVAQYMMWMKFSTGQGVPLDAAKGVYWLEKSAAQGFALAQHNLGHLYLKGDQGVPQDFSKAMVWFRKAADQGYAGAQNSIGIMYIDAKGVERDIVEAYKWFLLAKEDPHLTPDTSRVVSQNIAFVEERMTADEVVKGKREAQDWLAHHHRQ